MNNNSDFGLYIHWPYCTRICPYCDFNIYKNKPDAEQALIYAILEDMKYWHARTRERVLSSIHFGGGTPSLITQQNLETLINAAKNLWGSAPDLEIGLEANPNNINPQVLKNWHSAGIERLSIGVQSFDDTALKFLGRDHDGLAAKRALTQAIKVMPRVSADLIYGWAGQECDMWEEEILSAIASGAAHISAYQLTIEARTAFAKAQARGERRAVDDDKSADLYERGLAVLEAHGFAQYEVSNYAKSPQDRSRHNLVYWQGGDYIGIGPGAHGRVNINGKRHATICAMKPQAYIKGIKTNGHGCTEIEPLSAQGHAQEYVLMGLRISEGIDLGSYKDIAGHDLNPDAIKHYVEAGLLCINNERLSASPEGRLVLDRLSHELLS